MAFIAGNVLNLVSAELTNVIGKLIFALYESIGSFGWTVVVFTLILKTILLPIDWWQKSVTRKNNRIMQRMKPQLEKLQKQCGNDKQLYSQKQMELYKKEHYSMMGACLPMVVTMAIFFVVFGGFNATVRYQNQLMVEGMVDAYCEYLQVDENGTPVKDANGMLIITDSAAAKNAATQYFKDNKEGWLWIENVFMPDTWSDVVTSLEQYTGTGIGKLGIKELPDYMFVVGSYDKLLEQVSAEYNKTSFWDFKHWNGYLILPLISVLLSVLSQLLMKGSQSQLPQAVGNSDQQKSQQATMKMMQYMMPAMMGIFSLFYSSAFTIYMFFSSLYSIVFQLIYNYVTKIKDAKEDEAELLNKFKRA